MKTSEIRKFPIALMFSALLIGMLTSEYYGHGSQDMNNDFWVYYSAAKVVSANPRGDIYRGNTDGNPQGTLSTADSPMYASAQAAGIGPVMRYLYPPTLADLLIPIAHLSASHAAIAWRTINVVLLFIITILLTRMLHIPLMSFEAATIACCSFFFNPVRETLYCNNVSIMLAALCMMCIFTYEREKILLSAFFLAFATALKVTPLVILPIFFIWKDRRWITYYFVSLAGILAALTSFNGLASMRMAFFTLIAMGPGCPLCLNKCIGSLFTWTYFHRLPPQCASFDALINTAPGLRVAIHSADLSFYIACLIPVWMKRSTMDRTARALTVSIFAVVALCIAPVSWEFSYVMAIPALVMCWTYALRKQLGLVHMTFLAVVSTVMGTVFAGAGGVAHYSGLPDIAEVAISGLWVLLAVIFCLFAVWRLPSLYFCSGE